MVQIWVPQTQTPRQRLEGKSFIWEEIAGSTRRGGGSETGLGEADNKGLKCHHWALKAQIHWGTSGRQWRTCTCGRERELSIYPSILVRHWWRAASEGLPAPWSVHLLSPLPRPESNSSKVRGIQSVTLNVRR